MFSILQGPGAVCSLAPLLGGPVAMSVFVVTASVAFPLLLPSCILQCNVSFSIHLIHFLAPLNIGKTFLTKTRTFMSFLLRELRISS